LSNANVTLPVTLYHRNIIRENLKFTVDYA
jgi:hypothetical protein